MWRSSLQNLSTNLYPIQQPQYIKTKKKQQQTPSISYNSNHPSTATTPLTRQRKSNSNNNNSSIIIYKNRHNNYRYYSSSSSSSSSPPRYGNEIQPLHNISWSLILVPLILALLYWAYSSLKQMFEEEEEEERLRILETGDSLAA